MGKPLLLGEGCLLRDRNDDPTQGPVDESLRQRVMALVAPLPAPKVRDLLRQVSRLAFPGHASRAEIVKRTVIEYLNRRRPQRARRLFTELFEPILVGDPLFLRARRVIPGMVQRVDVAGLWAALDHTEFAKTADMVQHRLDEMAETEVLDDVFHEPETEILRQCLCQRAVEVIGRCLGDHRKQLAFLEAINLRRLSEAREGALHTTLIAPVEASFLRFVVEYLAATALCGPILKEHLIAASHDHDALPLSGRDGSVEGDDAERVASQLRRGVQAFRDTVVTPQARSELVLLVPLTALNVGRQYRAVGLYLRQNGFRDDGDDVFVIEAMMTHFAACCANLSAILGGTLKFDTRLPGALIRFTAREKAELEQTMDCLFHVMPALGLAGFLGNSVTGPIFAHLWQDLGRFLSERLVPVVMRRLAVIMTQRADAAPDYKEVVWLLRLIWGWHLFARTQDQAFGAFDAWLDQVREDLEASVGKAVRMEAGEAVAGRFDHLLRLNEIALVFNLRLAQYLSVSSRNVVDMMAYGLGQRAGMSPDERLLVVDYLDLVRAEVSRSRHWKSPELTDLLKVAAARGF